jgi:hypothetical protein
MVSHNVERLLKLRVCLVAQMEFRRPASYILHEGKQAQLVQILRKKAFGETA